MSTAQFRTSDALGAGGGGGPEGSREKRKQPTVEGRIGVFVYLKVWQGELIYQRENISLYFKFVGRRI